MSKRIRGIISFLLVFVLCFGMIPNVSAAEIGATESIIETEATEATTTETTAPPDETSPTETSAETTPPTEESVPPTTDATIPETEPEDDLPSDIVISSGVNAASTDDNGIMLAASTQNSIMLFDFADNGDYTSRLNSQLSVSYKPNGSGTTRTAYIKNLGWHFARYGNVPYADDPLYCIEPWRNYGASTSGNSVDRDVTMDGSGNTSGSNVWYALPAARREAIGLILLYSDQMWDDSISVFNVRRDSNPNVPLRVATQFLIYEIVCGLRNPTTFALNSTNECGTAGDIFYNAGTAAISNFAPNYNTLVSYVQSAMKRPSFTGSSSSNAPYITLTGDETSVYDSNGVLSEWSFTDGNGAEFYKSGNYLYIYQTGTISESTVFKATKYVPSAANSTYNIWYMSGSSYQTTISLASPSYGNLNAYFRLDPPDLGNLNLTKTTEDGKNLANWRFGIYSNSACTSLVAGPYTTNSSGKISVTGLSAGTYYVKELGHTDSSINALYYCSSTNPQKVTITAGGTASVSFTNKLNTGNLSLTKTTEDGKNLDGWKFSIYSDSACTSLVSGPHTTNTGGKISITGLKPGTYYVKEIGHTDSSINALYYCSSTNPQKVTITANSTTSVSFTNKLNTSSLSLTKTTDDGKNLAGWQFGIYTNSACTTLISGPHTTDANGKISVTGLTVGTVYVKELGHTDSAINAMYTCSSTNPQKITLTAGQTASVSFVNKIKPSGLNLTKTTEDGKNLSGWQFSIYSDAACTTRISGPHTTDANGKISVTGLSAGTVYVKEIGHTDSAINGMYSCSSTNPQKVTLTIGQTSSVSFINKLNPSGLNLTKTTEDGKNLSGWQFGIYSNSACTALVSGPHTTDANGKISVTDLSAGTVYVKELGHTDSAINSMYSCNSTNPQQVTLTAGQTASVSFVNKLNPSGLNLAKTTQDNQNLSGWKFSIYSDSACTTLVSGPHTTDANGKISVTGLSSGTVYVKELGHQDSTINALYTCSSENPQKVILTAGQSASVSFHNVLKTGNVKLVKETNTGENLAGWQIGLYYDADCTQSIEGSPFTTGADGSITVPDLQPGTLYAKEIPTEDPYWAFDTEVKKVTITASQTATVTFTNTHYGRIEFRKTTNTGNHLGGWTFRVTDKNAHIVGEYTTDDNGYACTENLPLGRYTVIELQTEDYYWNCELGFHDVSVLAGQTVVDEWMNREQGLGWFHKKTNTGESLKGWHITVYADEACTQEIRTMITNEEGKIGYYMDPGTYWAKETGDEYGRFENEYWLVDESIQKFEIKPHEDTEIIFTNVQYGKVKISKTMETEGSVADWQFKVTDDKGKEIEGSPFTSDENGEILTKLLPGTYTIEELIPKDSLYHCTSENPQTVTIAQGQTAEVTFTNALRPGKITLDKVDIKGNSLAGATFLLEWSEDGSLWWPIEYSETFEKGCCSNPNVVDGLLTTGTDGKLEWDNLHPGLLYRLTETKSPHGYSKLRKPAYEGELPEEDFSLEVKVINSRTFTLPETGSVSLMLSSFSMSGCLLGLFASYMYLRKKEQ